MSYDSSPPVYECGNAVKHDGKKRDLDSKQYKDQAKSRKEKRRMIRDTRNCRLENPETSTSKLAEAFNVLVPTARKYLSMPGQEIGAMDSPKEYKKRKTQMDGYASIIFKTLRDAKPADAIARTCATAAAPAAR